MSYIQPTNHIQFILRPETAIIKEAFRSLDATNVVLRHTQLVTIYYILFFCD